MPAQRTPDVPIRQIVRIKGFRISRIRMARLQYDNILLIGAGGGVGIHGVQVAKLFGARIIAADISDQKLALAQVCGADEVINVRNVPNPAQEAKRVTGGKGVDAAIRDCDHGRCCARLDQLGRS
jgi:NADPH:quinone reductase-like Zn-dependent oxidoreductase